MRVKRSGTTWTNGVRNEPSGENWGVKEVKDCVNFARRYSRGAVSVSFDPRNGGTCDVFSDNAIFHNTNENPRLQNFAEESNRGNCGPGCRKWGNLCDPKGCSTEEKRQKQA